MIVAVLSVFAYNNELESPGSIPQFLSFFIVVNWVWISQINYDLRFQAEDYWHR